MYNTKRRGALDFTYQLKMTIEENNNLTKSVEELSKELSLLRKDYDLINTRLKNYEEKDKKLKIFFKKYNVLDFNELTDIIVKYKNNKCSCIPAKDTNEYKELQKQIEILELNSKKQLKLESQNISLKNEIHNLNQELNNFNNKKKINVENIDIDKIKESIKKEYDIHIKNITEEHNKILTEIQEENIKLKFKIKSEMEDKNILPTPSNSNENKGKKLEKNTEEKINIVIDKIIRNNKLIKDEEDRLKLIKENRCKIDTLSFFNEKYGNNNNNNIKLLSISYDKNPSRFKKMIKIYSLIKNNKKLYNSNLLFQYHTFDDIGIKDNLVSLIEKMEINLINCNNIDKNINI